MDNAIHQVAAAVVKAALARGAVGIVLEDLSGFTENLMETTAHESNRTRARIRKKFLQWHQGALRMEITHAAEREGLWVESILPSYTSKTCSVCGIVWSNTSPKTVTQAVRKALGPDVEVRVEKPINGFGRISQSVFNCSCGNKVHADRNAGINIARRGLFQHPEQPVESEQSEELPSIEEIMPTGAGLEASAK